MGLTGSRVLFLSLSALGRFLVSWPALKAEDGCPPNQEVIPGPARTTAPKAGVMGMSQAGAACGQMTIRLLSLLHCPRPGSGESQTPEHASVLWASFSRGVQFTRTATGAGLRAHLLNDWLILRCPFHDDIASKASEPCDSSLHLFIQVCSGSSKEELGLQQAVQGI